MQITRHNYETFFLLYIDNELAASERLFVEAFVEANPDLRQELDFLQDSILKPDNRIVFKNPEILHQSISGVSIDSTNREEYFLLYADGELDKTNIQLVEEFLAAHPVYQPELQQILDAKLVPDLSEVFRDKQSLHRSEEKSRPIVIRWATVSAAACLLLIAGATWWYNNSLQNDAGIAFKPVGEKPLPPATMPAPAKLAVTPKRNTESALSNNLQAAVVIDRSSVSKQEKRLRSNNRKAEIPVVPGSLAQQKTSADRKPIAPAVTNTSVTPELAIAPENVQERPSPSETALATAPKTAVVDEQVTYADPLGERNDKDVILTNVSDEKKNVFRGLIRKTARFIDRNTSIKAPKKSGIHIGNIEIAFQ